MVDSPVVVTFCIPVTDRTRSVDGSYNVRDAFVTVLADGSADPSLDALQMVAAVNPDGMILGCDLVSAVC